ncbi:SubName: Full=Uncharacterized protein {ECO:0000313/EMBL:CCA68288.1} [Serendipita indica DSM 11827]|uniref:Uncharacterized protein n=1 Tax=Serendipita indica (strain DSM 11827) TaxID=1109443 RepID=G4TAD4_SERID|nr:SubName: Full=Uncharacterized protein {ECO:0000313/EMBL:CCA68288.1} [Serendipita indica DSM 11827]CCA68288.1 hypothetical protein PIIN_02152 [Serendipita indica DSM 11827]
MAKFYIPEDNLTSTQNHIFVQGLPVRYMSPVQQTSSSCHSEHPADVVPPRMSPQQAEIFGRILSIDPVALNPFGRLSWLREPNGPSYRWQRRTSREGTPCVHIRPNCTHADITMRVRLGEDVVVYLHVPRESWETATCDSRAVRAAIQKGYLSLLSGNPRAIIVRAGMYPTAVPEVTPSRNSGPLQPTTPLNARVPAPDKENIPPMDAPFESIPVLDQRSTGTTSSSLRLLVEKVQMSQQKDEPLLKSYFSPPTIETDSSVARSSRLSPVAKEQFSHHLHERLESILAPDDFPPEDGDQRTASPLPPSDMYSKEHLDPLAHQIPILKRIKGTITNASIVLSQLDLFGRAIISCIAFSLGAPSKTGITHFEHFTSMYQSASSKTVHWIRMATSNALRSQDDPDSPLYPSWFVPLVVLHLYVALFCTVFLLVARLVTPWDQPIIILVSNQADS